ncbi:hypothetical protein CLV89_11525 [Tritonibacter scottomollicae]|uniref:Uncharacterized protein n=1 Tax=Tritonibacter scottomollicae TaxID=483013 RepID=A0A2T1AA10_TRISK|nr:hypothetical protein CLV89_11525 [Tritonibacter scottomollicae]
MEHRMTLYSQFPDRGRTSACTEAGRKITLIATPLRISGVLQDERIL